MSHLRVTRQPCLRLGRIMGTGKRQTFKEHTYTHEQAHS